MIDETKEFVNKVKHTIKKHDMIEPGEKVVVAVSGGPDSMALLNSLYALKDELNFSLHVCHLNHQLRGAESDEDQKFVTEQSLKLELPISSQSFNVLELIRQRGVSLQDGARRIRYEYFQKLAAEVKADKIALGHTLDDQAETIFMRLLRGSGRQGLGGIPPKRGKYIRPLIDISRNEIMEYLKQLNVSARQDSSNKKSIYLRNKVRLELIPIIEKNYNPSLKSTLHRTADILNAEDELLDQIVEEKINQLLLQFHQTELQLDLKILSKHHIALQRRILRSCIAKLKPNLEDISFEHIEAALSLLKSNQPNSRLCLPHQMVVSREYDKLIIRLAQSDPKPFEQFEVQLKSPGETEIPQIGIKVITQFKDVKDITKPITLYLKSNEPLKSEAQREYAEIFDADKISFPLKIRNRKAGDRFIPLGMSHPKKLKDFFIDEKVLKSERGRIPLLVDEKGILWVVGYRMSDTAKLTQKTQRALKVSLQPSAFSHQLNKSKIQNPKSKS